MFTIKKYSLITLLFLALFVVGGFFWLQRGEDDNDIANRVLASQEECEKETQIACTNVMCDFIPEGKTVEEVCGKDFIKGWRVKKDLLDNEARPGESPSPGASPVSSASPESFESTDKKPETQYRWYELTRNADRAEILDAKYISPATVLPKLLTMDGKAFIVKSIRVEKSALDAGHTVSIYAMVEYQGKEQKVGFWYNNPDPLNDTNACAGTDPTIPDCKGVLIIQTKEWQDKASPEDEKQGAIEFIVFREFLTLTGIDYNYETNSWNTIEFQIRRNKEIRPPSSIN